MLKVNIENSGDKKASPDISVVDSCYVNLNGQGKTSIGVSLGYGHDSKPDDKQKSGHPSSVTQSDSKNKIKWYVLRAGYGTELKYRDLFIEKGFEAYVPMLYVKKEERDDYDNRTIVIRKFRKPVSNLLFVKASRVQIDDFIRNISSMSPSHLHYYYDHTEGLPQGKENPITISDGEMRNFRMVADVDDCHVEMVSPGECHFKDGSIVLVKEGRFKGVVGRVARVHRQQRVLVGAGGFIIATSYVPTKFFEKLPQD